MKTANLKLKDGRKVAIQIAEEGDWFTADNNIRPRKLHAGEIIIRNMTRCGEFVDGKAVFENDEAVRFAKNMGRDDLVAKAVAVMATGTYRIEVAVEF